MTAHLLSDGASAAAVEAFVLESPDHTVYHRPPYVDFARAQNGEADLVMLSTDGQALLAFPFHPGRRRVSTGYAGVCFRSGHSALRRGVTALGTLMRLNPRLRFQSLQSAQAPAVDDVSRAGLLACLIDSLDVRQEPLHTRLLRLPAVGSTIRPPPQTIVLDDSHLPLLRGYDGDLRNQIRQASRRGVNASVVIPTNRREAADVYAKVMPIHTASWERTGMEPHTLAYLLGLESAVRNGGGSDVVVLAQNSAGEAIAAVTCHVYGDRAIYWSGCSLPAALSLRANPFCLHASVYALQKMGVRTFELGRFDATESDPKEISVTRYKDQFGGDVQRLLNFEFGAPRVDARAKGRSVRNHVRTWLRQRRTTTPS
jgi:hypothetical protein